MRDRTFLTWLLGLLVMAILLDRYPMYAATAPIVLCVAAVLAVAVTAAVSAFERGKGDHERGHSAGLTLVHLRRPMSHR